VPVSSAIILGLLLTLFASGASAEPVMVRFWESATHGFLVLRNDQGGAIALGELVQAPHGEGMPRWRIELAAPRWTRDR